MKGWSKLLVIPEQSVFLCFSWKQNEYPQYSLTAVILLHIYYNQEKKQNCWLPMGRLCFLDWPVEGNNS